MSTPAASELPLDAARALLSHLRENPADAASPPEELAARFGLDPDLVGAVLRQGRPEGRDRELFRFPRLSFGWLGRARRAAVRMFDGLIAAPTLFVAITFALALALALAEAWTQTGAGTAESALRPRALRQGAIRFLSPEVAALLSATLLVHMAVYFRRAMTRFALYGGLVVWVLGSFAAMTFAWLDYARGPEPVRAVVTLAVGLGLFPLALMYAGAGALAAVLGGWVRLRQTDRRQERMSRQELLERYFELQSRLEAGAEGVGAESWRVLPVVRHVRRRPFLWAFASGLVFGVFSVLLYLGFRVAPFSPSPQAPPVAFLVLDMTRRALKAGAVVVLAFLAGNVSRSIFASLLFSLGGVIARLAPVAGFGPSVIAADSVRTLLGIDALFFALLAAVVGAGALVQERSAYELSLQRNDRAAILGEMLRIQWRLNDRKTVVCVMVVDAARSAEMKLSADPLAVEYSFREYQEWIEAISQTLGGKVHATAGDGAVVAFPSCAEALTAAKRVQTDLDRFNREVNRLRTSFRLRIGLHVGAVAGELDKVQFTDVIDIAAHVQAVAPIAGIAATDDVVEQLPDEEFVPLARLVDGHQVFLALDPTEDA